MAKAEELFPDQDREEIVASIKKAENQTSGEIRLFMEDTCSGSVLDRAAFIFKELKMHNTRLRNGVLFYLAVENKQFAILGDHGINQKVPSDFWDQIKHTTIGYFKRGEFKIGLCEGISMAGDALKTYFPHEDNDSNELSDDIVFGK